MRPLSPRLRALFDAVPSGVSFADVCTDHAQLPMALVRAGRVSRAIAIDKRPTPLADAAQSLARAGLSDRVELRQGDGLKVLHDHEAQCVVLAGIGGRLVQSILNAGLPLGIERLVVQVNRRQDLARRTLVGLGYALVDEQITHSAGRDFVTMVGDAGAVDESAGWSEFQWQWGPILLARRDPGLRERLAQALQRCADNLAAQRGGGGLAERPSELTQRHDALSAALQAFDAD